ncbi:hypothetical protein AX16_009959 [Volvariella volvacea WC 439]|nr:hypothetical protein AX16_009959 [Volvariella volvacea WC 439]
MSSDSIHPSPPPSTSSLPSPNPNPIAAADPPSPTALDTPPTTSLIIGLSLGIPGIIAVVLIVLYTIKVKRGRGTKDREFVEPAHGHALDGHHLASRITPFANSRLDMPRFGECALGRFLTFFCVLFVFSWLFLFARIAYTCAHTLPASPRFIILIFPFLLSPLFPSPSPFFSPHPTHSPPPPLSTLHTGHTPGRNMRLAFRRPDGGWQFSSPRSSGIPSPGGDVPLSSPGLRSPSALGSYPFPGMGGRSHGRDQSRGNVSDTNTDSQTVIGSDDQPQQQQQQQQRAQSPQLSKSWQRFLAKEQEAKAARENRRVNGPGNGNGNGNGGGNGGGGRERSEYDVESGLEVPPPAYYGHDPFNRHGDGYMSL